MVGLRNRPDVYDPAMDPRGFDWKDGLNRTSASIERSAGPNRRGRTVPRRGTARAWSLLGLAILVTSAGVWIFVRNLPGPPRYDPLRLEVSRPGMERQPYAHRFGWTVDDRTEELSWRSEAVGFEEGEVAPPEILAATGDVGDWVRSSTIPISRTEPTPAILGFETRDLRIELLVEGASVLVAGGAGDSEVETEPILLPAGASTLTLRVTPVGAATRLKAWWREPDGERSTLRSLGSDDAG